MPFTPRSRIVNPRLGTYFGIFASGLASLVLLAAILEQLGLADRLLRWVMLAGPVALTLGIAIAAASRQVLDYFAAGRRVPAVYTGLLLAVTALGASGLATLTGVLFVLGFDGLAFMVGGLAGFVVMAILLAPFLRKFGAYTLPSYLGRRFESRALRLLAAAMLCVPLVLMASAEVIIGARLVTWLTGTSAAVATAAMSLAILAAILPGGIRSLTWSSTAQAITALLAILIPAAIVAVLVTKLPIPQLSYGPIVRSLIREEVALGLPDTLAAPLALAFPEDGYVAIAKRFVTPFGAVGPIAFVVTALTVMAGFASAPWLLPRVAATPSVYDARKSLGWATMFFGLLFLTMTAIAAFMRAPIMDLALDPNLKALPEWARHLTSAGLAKVPGDTFPVALQSFTLNRDYVLLALPTATGLPGTIVYLVAAALVAAALACAGATVANLANILAEDIVNGLTWEPPVDGARLLLARALLLLAMAGVAAVSLLTPSDPLRLMHWALVVTAATAFPVLILSIWWKRLNGFGAVAGMATGFALAVGAITAGETGLLETPGPLVAAAGLPAGAIVAMIVAVLTPAPSRHALELVRDIRVPGGEILYDREMQRLRLKHRRAGG